MGESIVLTGRRRIVQALDRSHPTRTAAVPDPHASQVPSEEGTAAAVAVGSLLLGLQAGPGAPPRCSAGEATMAWSTSRIADLASTTVNTVRHYHRLGLLAEPERRGNGYKQYGVPHLVQLLRIRRLVDLGLPLGQIESVSAGGPGVHEVLRALDSKLVAGIEQLQRARRQIATILREGAPADAPAGFEAVASGLSEAERSILHITGQFYDVRAMADLRRIAEADALSDGLGAQFDGLPPDADEPIRERLARRLAPALARNFAEYPWLSDPSEHLSRSEQDARETISAALAELYSPAQQDVLARAGRIAHEL